MNNKELITIVYIQINQKQKDQKLVLQIIEISLFHLDQNQNKTLITPTKLTSHQIIWI